MARPKSTVKKKPTKTPVISPVQSSPSQTYATIEKAAVHCGVSLQTFRNYLNKYPDLPVVEKSHSGSGYKIDLIELDKWREKNELLNWKPVIIGNEGRAPKQTEKNKDRKEKIQADLLELEFKRKSEQFIDRNEWGRYFGTKIAEMAQKLDRCPVNIAYKLQLSPEIAEEITKAFYECRVALVRDDNNWFTYPETEESPV